MRSRVKSEPGACDAALPALRCQPGSRRRSCERGACGRGARGEGRAWAARGEGLRRRGLSLTAQRGVRAESPPQGWNGLEKGGMAGGGIVSTGGAESRCRAGPLLVPCRRMEFELLENDVLESLEDLGYVSGGEGRSRCGPGPERGPGRGHSSAVRLAQAGPLSVRRAAAQGSAWSGLFLSEPLPKRGW